MFTRHPFMSSDEPRISTIIPAYNVENYIEAALDSGCTHPVIAQMLLKMRFSRLPSRHVLASNVSSSWKAFVVTITGDTQFSIVNGSGSRAFLWSGYCINKWSR